MDIPSLRKNTDNEANVRWLLRNLAIRNHKHEHFQEAINLLKQEVAPMLGD